MSGDLKLKPVGGKKKKSKALLIIIMALAEMLVLGVICGYAYFLKQYSKVQRPHFEKAEVQNENLSEKKIREMKGYRMVAIFGVDSRDNSVGKGNNSDVIMIANINQDTGAIRMVSIFRDTYLKVNKSSYRKINAAYAEGGPAQAVKALNENLDLNITEYVTFSWKAVATGINILGGVDMDITKPEFRYINSYITFTVKATQIGSTQLDGPGMHHLDGVQAVAYARLRYMDSDYARTERQRKVVSQALDKAKAADLKTLNDLLGNMLSMVATNLTWQDGLDVIADINKYHFEETAGFPFARTDMMLGSKGAIVVPTTLESNVKELHRFLFGDENYQVSSTVKNISAKVSADTGYYKEGTNVYHVPTDEGYMPDDEGGSGRRSKGGKRTREYDETKKESGATDENGRYYETNEDGETVYIEESVEEVTKESTRVDRSSTGASTGSSQAGTTGATSAGETKATEKESQASTELRENKTTRESTNIGPAGTSTAPKKTTATQGPAGTSASQKKTTEGGGPGMTTTAPTTESRTNPPTTPATTTGKTTAPTTTVPTTVPPVPTETEPATVEPVTSAAAPTDNGPGSGKTPQAESRPRQ